MLLSGQIFKGGVQQRRIFHHIIREAGFIHRSGSGQELTDVKADAGSHSKAHIAEHTEASAYSVGNGILGPALLHGQLFQQGGLLGIGVCYSHNLYTDILTFLQLIVHHHEVGHGIKSTAGLADYQQQHRKLPFPMTSAYGRLVLQMVYQVTGTARVNILP